MWPFNRKDNEAMVSESVDVPTPKRLEKNFRIHEEFDENSLVNSILLVGIDPNKKLMDQLSEDQLASLNEGLKTKVLNSNTALSALEGDQFSKEQVADFMNKNDLSIDLLEKAANNKGKTISDVTTGEKALDCLGDKMLGGIVAVGDIIEDTALAGLDSLTGPSKKEKAEEEEYESKMDFYSYYADTPGIDKENADKADKLRDDLFKQKHGYGYRDLV